MKTPADCPHLSEYLPYLRYLWHLAGLKMIPALELPETTLPPAGFPALVFLAADVLAGIRNRNCYKKLLL